MGRSRRAHRGVVAAAVAFVVAVSATVGVVAWKVTGYDRNIQRIAGALPEESDRPLPDPGENWLLVGSDMRGQSTAEKWRSGEAESDVIILLHVPDGAKRAYVISFPRDAWVDIPGHEPNKINASFRMGGPSLLVATVERRTGVRVDHFAAIDFQGFERMIDVLGGVEIYLPEEVYDPSNGWYWPAGTNHMDGEEALRFVRERKGLSGSDLDRIRRQHVFLNAVAEKAANSDLRSNPVKLDAFLRAASDSMAVDEGTTMRTLRALAQRLIEVGPENATFVSLPVEKTDWVGNQNVVRLDEELNDGLFAALREERLDSFVAEHDLANDAEELNWD